MASLYNAQRPLHPPTTKASRREHQYSSGENRQARLKLPIFQQRLKTFYQMFGGKAKTLQYFRNGTTHPSSWASHLPSVENNNIELAFEKWIEANEHGDSHALLQTWSDVLTLKHGKPVNFVIPFLRVNVWGNTNGEQNYGKQSAQPHLWVILNNPDDHQRIALNHTSKSPLFGATNYGNNFLAHVDNDEWKRRRFGMIFAVSPRANATYFHKMERHAHALIHKLETGVGGQFTYGQSTPHHSFNIHSMIEHTAFAIAADCLYDADDALIEKWSQKIRWALQVTSREGATQASAILQGWTDALMGRPIPTDMNGPLLQALHQVGEEYPDPKEHPQKATLGDVSILTLAMHDTTASTMTFCLAELARRPALQELLAAEVATVLVNKDHQQRSMTYDDLYQMPLLTKVLNE